MGINSGIALTIETSANPGYEDKAKSRAWRFSLSTAITDSLESPIVGVSDGSTDNSVVSDEELDDEALWDKQFADSQDLLDRIADEIQAKYLAGLTEDFDPDTDPDLR